MTNSNKLRKAAILITALDARSADALLEQMPEAYANRVRAAVFELDDIDPEEQQEILSEFLRSTGRQAEAPVQRARQSSSRTNDDDTVELVLSQPGEAAPSKAPQRPVVSYQTYRNPYPAKTESAAPNPFEFLGGLDGHQLGRLLEREHPQTIAVVAAHLPPERAAELIGELSASLQADVLGRVADLSQIDPETLADMEQELRRLFHAAGVDDSQSRPGVSTVSSILAAAGTTRTTLLRNLRQHDEHLSRQIGGGTQADVLSAPIAEDDAWESDWHGEPLVEPAPRDLHSEIEAHRRVGLSAQQFGQWQGVGEDSPAAIQEADEPIKSHKPPIEWTFSDLDTLSDGDLARVLRSAESDLTMVALAGAEPAFVARLTKQLPPAMARQFSRKIETVGPLSLRDIEAAQRRIAEIAADLAEQGVIQQKPSRPFAMAA